MTNEEFLRRISLDGEVWKDVVGYEGYYMVSNLGRVCSLYRTILTKDGRYRKLPGVVLKPKKRGIKSTHQVIHLNKDGIMIDASVHRLVAQHFLPNPSNYPIVEHLDCDPTNNKVDNLRWTDQKGNMNNPISLARNSLSQKLSTKKKRTPVVCIKDGVAIKTYPSMIAAEIDGFRDSGIDGVIRGLHSHHKGFQWMKLSDYEASCQ